MRLYLIIDLLVQKSIKNYFMLFKFLIRFINIYFFKEKDKNKMVTLVD